MNTFLNQMTKDSNITRTENGGVTRKSTESNQKREYVLYLHRNKINNKVYIEITKQHPPEKRWKNGNSYKHNQHFNAAIQKYGWDNFQHLILKENLTLEEANIEEIKTIAFYDSTNYEKGYNIQIGGNHSPQSEQTKEKIRQKALDWSDEVKKKMSDAAKKRVARDGAPFQGKHLSEEAKNKLRKVDKSYTQTEQYREKMSKATSGAKNGSAKKIKAISENKKEVLHFGYKQEAMNFLGLSRSSQKFLNKAIKNHTIYHNYYWEEE